MRWLDLGLADELSSARCPPSRAVELAARELAPLVEQWLELARIVSIAIVSIARGRWSSSG